MPSEPKSTPRLIRRPVYSTLWRMALPMLGGTFAMNAFNLADTWFVAKLGTVPLAAMGFSFPVVMLLITLALGLGMGATTVISQALGASDHERAKRLTTHAIILCILIVVFVSVVGLLTIEPVFRALGAGPEVMPAIRGYMQVWYLGVIFLVIPMVANNIIRATGDTIRPSIIMGVTSVLNIFLDPIFIFGFAFIPEMGIQGAALATVLSRAVSCVAALWILIHQYDLITFSRLRWANIWNSWKAVMRIGLPSTVTQVLMPIAGAIITWLLARHGPAAVAAAGVAGRLEMFAFMVPMALGISLVPFVGQNFGAGRLDRVKEGMFYGNTFAFGYGLIIAVVFWIFAPQIGGLFSQDEAVIGVLTQYMRIIPVGYGLLEIQRYSGFLMNGINKPMQSLWLNALRIIVLLIPLSLLGDKFLGLTGIFWGRLIADVVSGTVGLVWAIALLRKVSAEKNAG
ncbi:MATE family efflux transporter [Puniceicoccus vermicola]|uniref:MATE family efflux transporter n=1 Tax=Puniceicoccus vermicola TaxID=388746 RepID=A0A7X1E4H7_9BACT|nr:MATE family efflux transporter [Puniceicoccus vermicola]MBC2602555.1 MATE family efflux transporter [Puniceicoccus vermicola]